MKHLALGLLVLSAGCGAEDGGTVRLDLGVKTSPLVETLALRLEVRQGSEVLLNAGPVAPAVDWTTHAVSASLPFSRLPLSRALTFHLSLGAASVTLLEAERTATLKAGGDVVAFDNTHVVPASWDNDGDGFSNLHEFLVGASPNDSGSTPPGPYCVATGDCDGGRVCSALGNCLDTAACNNNGSRGAGEECDGVDLGGLTCAGLGYGGGSLGCVGCRLDLSACTQP